MDSQNLGELASVIDKYGFAVCENIIDDETINTILKEIQNISLGLVSNRRAEQAFGIRNLLNVVPSTRELANDDRLRSLIERVLGEVVRVVRGLYLDKHREANWKAAWHQDLTIAVRDRIETEGFGPWSIKAGITHVQPPFSVLENILALRLHLDDADESNGALRVIPGSHKHGRLADHEIQLWKDQNRIITCPVKKGEAMLMRPLLLHASSVATRPFHRRVLHFEYVSMDLPGGLEWYDA